MPIQTSVWRNLACRNSNGCMVTLDYSREDSGDARVRVTFNGPESDFILYPPNDRALDCYHHPYVYLNRVLQRGTYRESVNAGIPIFEQTR